MEKKLKKIDYSLLGFIFIETSIVLINGALLGSYIALNDLSIILIGNFIGAFIISYLTLLRLFPHIIRNNFPEYYGPYNQISYIFVSIFVISVATEIYLVSISPYITFSILILIILLSTFMIYKIYLKFYKKVLNIYENRTEK